MPFKCLDCLIILKDEDTVLKDDKFICPECGNILIKMCSKDKVCDCVNEIHSGTHKCPECDAFTCECGSHDVIVISRVTGYLAEVGGWGAGKKAEFADRTRYDVA